MNEEIKAKEIRVLNSQNEQLGIMSLNEALQLAAEQNLDLVEVSPTAKPPVCRIIDSGKFRYERQKKAKEVKKKQKVTALKEVKIRPNIEEHDFKVKLKNAQRFLDSGDKVKVTITFRGRELSHPELGKQLLVKMGDLLKEAAIIEREAKLEGKNMIMILSPKSSTAQTN
jgi:translation initiation factor IF-3